MKTFKAYKNEKTEQFKLFLEIILEDMDELEIDYCGKHLRQHFNIDKKLVYDREFLLDWIKSSSFKELSQLLVAYNEWHHYRDGKIINVSDLSFLKHNYEYYILKMF